MYKTKNPNALSIKIFSKIYHLKRLFDENNQNSILTFKSHSTPNSKNFPNLLYSKPKSKPGNHSFRLS